MASVVGRLAVLRSKLFWIAVVTSFGLLFSQVLHMAKFTTSINPQWSSSSDHHRRSGRITNGDKASYFNVTGQRILFSEPGLDLYIHKAYRDDRMDSHSVIRVFGMERLEAITGNFTCRWSTGSDVTHEVPARKFSVDASWPHWGRFYACNFDCWVPKTTALQTVHLVSAHHGFDFEMEIEETVVSTPKRELAVCVKPLTGKFEVHRLVEWIEIQRLAGIEHFIMYNTDLHGPARFVLKYYSDRGVVTFMEFPYLSAVLKKFEPPALSSEDRYAAYQQTYLVAYQDCLYRFHGSYKFLEIIDVDEVMLPTAEENWPKMLNRLLEMKPASASFMFLTSWHFEESGMVRINGTEAPPYLYMQRYAIANQPIHNQPKSVVVTEHAVTVNFHGVVQATRPNLEVTMVPWQQFGYVHHYRGTCRGKFQPDRCSALMDGARVDPVVTRYKDNLQRRVEAVLDHLQLTRF